MSQTVKPTDETVHPEGEGEVLDILYALRAKEDGYDRLAREPGLRRMVAALDPARMQAVSKRTGITLKVLEGIKKDVMQASRPPEPLTITGVIVEDPDAHEPLRAGDPDNFVAYLDIDGRQVWAGDVRGLEGTAEEVRALVESGDLQIFEEADGGLRADVRRGEPTNLSSGEVAIGNGAQGDLSRLFRALKQLDVYQLEGFRLGIVVEGRAISFDWRRLAAWLPKHLQAVKVTSDDETGRETKKKVEWPRGLLEIAVHDIHNIGLLYPLKGIRKTPFYVGTHLVQTSGYDPASGMLYAPDEDFGVVPAADSQAAERRTIEFAKSWIDKLLSEFRFRSDADRTNMVGALLLGLLRGAYSGPTPAVWIEADRPGSGKSVLARAVQRLALNEEHTMAFTPRDEEMEKRLTSALLANPATVLLLDNLRDQVEGSALEALLTSTAWTSRRLGASEQVKIEHQALVLITGNGTKLSLDMARRVIPVRLSHPGDDFRPSFDLRAFVIEHRRKLVWCLLTLTQGWLAAGAPRGLGRTMASFEGATGVLDGILHFAGYSDFLGNREEAQSEATYDELPEVLEGCLDHAVAAGLATPRAIVDAAYDRAASAEGFAPLPPHRRASFEASVEKRLVDLGWRRGPKCRRTSPFSGTSLAKQWWQSPVA